MTKPKISVIIPVYNDEEYIDKCLSSIVDQTLKDIEIICINDESSDSSLEILKRYQEDDDRIKIINQKNQGAGASRNNGIDSAVGEYISFVDADDWLELDALEKLYGNAVSNDSDMVLFNSVELKEGGETRERTYMPEDDSIDYDNFVFDYNYNKNLVMNKMFVVWSKIYRTSFLKDNDLRFYTHKIFNDVQFHIETMLVAERISYLPEVLYNYNKFNDNSLQTVATNSNNRILIFDVFKGVKEFLVKNSFYDEFRQNFAQFLVVESRANLIKTNDDFKEEFYGILRCEYINMDIDGDILIHFPFGTYNFYMMVLNCETYYNFSLFKSQLAKDDGEFLDDLGEYVPEEAESSDQLIGDQKIINSHNKEFLFNLERQIRRKNEHIENLNAKIDVIEENKDILLERSRNAEINNRKLNKAIQRLETKNEKLESRIEDLKDRNERLVGTIDKLKAQIELYENSTSWKITKPLRDVTGVVKRK